MAYNILQAPSSAVSSVFSSVGSAMSTLQLTALLNDLNNIADVQNYLNHGWVQGEMPLMSNLYFFQPNLRNGNFIPQQLIKGFQLPDRTIQTSNITFRGVAINYATGSVTGDLVVTFYERQDLVVTGFYEAWKSYIASPSGGFYGLNNNCKYDMFCIFQQSLGGGDTSSLTGQFINGLPSNVADAVNAVNFAGIALLLGCQPTQVSYPRMENPNDGKVEVVEVQVTFKCDVCLKLPLSLNVDQILEILGVSRNGFGIGGSTSTSSIINSASSAIQGFF